MLVISIINFTLLFPLVINDLEPEGYYSNLLQYYTKSIEPDYIDYSLDTDSDGLIDYDEMRKYLTDPANPDSDNDGVFDGNWDERREYTRTYKVVVDLRMPYLLDYMNEILDHFYFADTMYKFKTRGACSSCRPLF